MHTHSLESGPLAAWAMNYGFFDEDYFERGERRGTAYRSYLQNSRSSPVYREIAEACAALRPRRALEIGCATGMVVAHLNRLGIEAHGIDVSEWAVAHREHSNVMLGGAEALPFADGHFDLVYSIHALEHIPEQLTDAAFAEMRRVSSRDAIHFHTLPILGAGPYSGDRAEVLAGLRKDPTHSLLHDEAWWLFRFQAIGLVETGARLLIGAEDQADLSVSQLLLASPKGRKLCLKAVRSWNDGVIDRLMRRVRTVENGACIPQAAGRPLRLALGGKWGDVETQADFAFDDDLLLTAEVAWTSPEPVSLRFCFLSAAGDESDLIRTYAPGTTIHQFRRHHLLQRLGSAGHVDRVMFGGQGSGEAQVRLVAEQNGQVVFAFSGPEPTPPPPAKSLLRHALQRLQPRRRIAVARRPPVPPR